MNLLELYKILFSSFGEQHWWPASSGRNKEFEICVGAILTQNTSWSNVEKAIHNLKKEKLLFLEALSKAEKKKIAELIKPALYFNQKAEYLQNFCRHIEKNYSGNLKEFFEKPSQELRKELLSIKGIGFETADSICLYAAQKPIFVIDAYTKRIISRAMGEKEKSYSELQEFFQKELPKNKQLYNEFHALLVCLGKNSCKKKNPLCSNCPINQKCVFANTHTAGK